MWPATGASGVTDMDSLASWLSRGSVSRRFSAEAGRTLGWCASVSGVRPGPARPGVGGEYHRALVVRVRERAADGRATAAALAAVAAAFAKIADIADADPAVLDRLLAPR